MHHRGVEKTWHQDYDDNLVTREEQIASRIAGYVGSLRFIKQQSFIISTWIVANAVAAGFQYGAHGFNFHGWDPYPFVLLNLVFSFQAAYTAPFILMDSRYSQLRDRHIAQATQREAEEIRHMLRRIERHLGIEEDRG